MQAEYAETLVSMSCVCQRFVKGLVKGLSRSGADAEMGVAVRGAWLDYLLRQGWPFRKAGFVRGGMLLISNRRQSRSAAFRKELFVEQQSEIDSYNVSWRSGIIDATETSQHRFGSHLRRLPRNNTVRWLQELKTVTKDISTGTLAQSLIVL